MNNKEIKLFAYEKIIDNLTNGVLLTDKYGEIILYNKAMEELEKKNSKEMVGKKIWNAYEYNDKNKSEHMAVLKSKTPVIGEYKAHAYIDGKPIYKSYNTIPISKEGNIIGVYSISKDEAKLKSLLSEIVELRRKVNKDKSNNYNGYNNGTKYTFVDIVGSSDKIKKTIKEAKNISWLDNSILIIGDTGTGKEVFAQSIHNYGERRLKPFIPINCSSIPENLIESILFGAVKGAYTGAVDSAGLFEKARNGTIFLDELNSMPIDMQAKLLRVLQEKKARRIGGNRDYSIECRIISATNEDPYLLIEKGRLREDLFYRISGYNIYLPKLIDRGEDIFELSERFISKYNFKMNKNILSMSKNLKKLMKKHDWPGNIRELEHFIENVMIRTKSNDKSMRVENIPNYIINTMNIPYNTSLIFKDTKVSFQDKLDSIEKEMIIEGLYNNIWNVSKTAKSLGLTRQSLIYRMRKLNIKRDDYIQE